MNKFVVTTNTDTTVRGTSKKVVVTEAFSLQQDGKVVAAVDAVYDFERVPEQYHSTLLWFISVTARPTLLLPTQQAVEPTPKLAPPPGKLSWWQRWFG